MNCDWQKKRLSEVAENASRPFDFSQREKVVFVNTGDVLEGRFLHNKFSPKRGLPGQAKKRIEKDDILLSEIRPANKRYVFVDFDADEYVVSTKFMVIRAGNSILPRYLYYLLTNQNALAEFQRIAESRSGTFPQITFDSIGHFPLIVPPIEEQRRIVEAMESIYRQVELNRQINGTLECLAESLFKSWMTDSAPVKVRESVLRMLNGKR